MDCFVDVILPLPLSGVFTYAVADARMQQVMQPGVRVIVPFGPKKIYTAIVQRVHSQRPEDYAVKQVLELLDEQPVVLPSQLKLWQWVAEYYLCAVGEVYKAAVPSGMKPESESIVVLNEEFEADAPLKASEQKILDLLAHQSERTLTSLQRDSGIRCIVTPVKNLMEMGALSLKEEVKESFHPRTVAYVRIASEYFDEGRLNELFAELKRSPKQSKVLLAYLELSQAPSALSLKNEQLLADVSKAELMQKVEVASSIVSALVKRGVLKVYDKEVGRIQNQTLPEHLIGHQLSPLQQQAVAQINHVFSEKDVCLLHGVTASGKTEVYIQLIKDALAQGKQVLYLLPEIVLTAQLTHRLQRVFGSRLGVYHSKFSDAERVEIWKKQLSSSPYDIIIGVRSSVFLPFQNLGLVLVDEEHEISFKQQEPAPRYHARDVAVVLASMCRAKVLLGTATPSFESYYNARNGKYGLVEMLTRYQNVSLPDIKVVDIKELHRKRRMRGSFSPDLCVAMEQAFAAHEQVILFQNRRGFAPQTECRTCGWVPRCKNCDVSMTYHKGLHRLTCHYCGFTCVVPTRCPACEGDTFMQRGFGTEKVEDEVKTLYPDVRISRMDMDTTRSKQGYEKIISEFQQGHTDVLVGTQMVTKGLDFDRVSVVGILNADTMLTQPDFRSFERSFQMMSQVAGRSGRRQHQGTVILQTKNPDLPVVSYVMANDYKQLYEQQLEERRLFYFPPFCRLISVVMKHRDQSILDQLAAAMAARMKQVFGDRVLGPDAPPVGRVQLLYIRQMMLKIEPNASMKKVRQQLVMLRQSMLADERFHAVQIFFDVDPY